MTISLHLRPSLQAKLFLPMLLVLGFGTSQVAVGANHRDSKHDAKHQVEALEEQWRTALITADIGTIDRLLSDDFVGISMTGQVNTKEQQLDRIRSRTLVLTRMDLSDRKVKLVGAVAIVTSLAEIEGTNEGQSMQGTFRYTRVYQRLPSGTWKTTNFEATRVPGPRRERPTSN